MPVAVPCHSTDVRAPAWPLDAIKPTDSDFDFYKAVLAEIEPLKGDEARLRAALAACQ